MTGDLVPPLKQLVLGKSIMSHTHSGRTPLRKPSLCARPLNILMSQDSLISYKVVLGFWIFSVTCGVNDNSQRAQLLLTHLALTEPRKKTRYLFLKGKKPEAQKACLRLHHDGGQAPASIVLPATEPSSPMCKSGGRLGINTL